MGWRWRRCSESYLLRQKMVDLTGWTVGEREAELDRGCSRSPNRGFPIIWKTNRRSAATLIRPGSAGAYVFIL